MPRKKPGMRSPTPPRRPTHHGQTANLPVIHTGTVSGQGGTGHPPIIKKKKKGGR